MKCADRIILNIVNSISYIYGASAKKVSRRCIFHFSPLELMGIVPGSVTTTIPATT